MILKIEGISTSLMTGDKMKIDRKHKLISFSRGRKTLYFHNNDDKKYVEFVRSKQDAHELAWLLRDMHDLSKATRVLETDTHWFCQF